MRKLLNVKVSLWKAVLMVLVALATSAYWVRKTEKVASDSLDNMKAMTVRSVGQSFIVGCFQGGQIHSFFVDSRITPDDQIRFDMAQWCVPAAREFLRGYDQE